MAANLLKEKGIPHFTQQEIAGGLKLAMPVAPATGSGIWWNLIVPRDCCESAMSELQALPFVDGTDPDIWDFQPRPTVKLAWKLYAAIILIMMAIGWILNLFN